MREFKFRAWDKKKRHWIDNFTITQDGKIIETNYNGVKFLNVDAILILNIGVQDKNGKDIYEGYIIEFIFKGRKYISELFFEDGAYMVRLNDVEYVSIDNPAIEFTFTQEDKVVGNVFEHPELLGAKDD